MSRLCAGCCLLAFAAAAVQAGPDPKTVREEAQRFFDNGDYRTAAAMLADEISRNPGHESAYELLARSYEKLGQEQKAVEVWTKLKEITRLSERKQEARLGLLRTRGPDVPKFDPNEVWENDPYKVDIGKINWERLAEEASGVSVKYNGQAPPYRVESPYFELFACTQRAAEVCTQLCESYTEFLLDKYFHVGQAWALRIPIVIYKDHDDYVRVGGHPEQSAGVTYPDPRTGAPQLIAMYMLDEDGKLDRDALEGTLPHELVHMVIHEWFGGRDVPRWIDEGLARRMEQSRKHYQEAAKVGRDAAAGEYYRFRDLFSQEQYPQRGDRTWRFYEQSATIVLFLLEQGGPDAAHAFFEALKAGKDHDEASAGALGIPVEGAIEEFEKRWMEWARKCYVNYSEKLDDGGPKVAGPVDDVIFTQTFAELPTVEKVERWNRVRTDSMSAFKDVGGSHRYWKSEEGRLVCSMEPSRIPSLLGIRMDEEIPMVMRCRVRSLDASMDNPVLFGISMLDHRSDDTGIQVMAPLSDRRPHRVTVVVSDEIALYLDDVCTGRFPSLRESDINEDIDWPLAFAAYSPVEVSDVEVGRIEDVVRVETVAKAD